MLSVMSLDVDYGNTKAVEDVGFVLKRGSSLAVLGPNGAGKTSCLNAVSGLVRYRGEIRFEGVDLGSLEPEEIARKGVIHVPEGRHVFGSLSVHENLRVGETARGGRGGGYSIDDVYDLFPPLAGISTRRGWALSGGEQQMVAVGRGLVANPRVLMLDEPTLGLAPVVVETVLSALSAVRSEVPILVIEQNYSAALRICDGGIVLAEGRVVMEGRRDEILGRAHSLRGVLGESELSSEME